MKATATSSAASLILDEESKWESVVEDSLGPDAKLIGANRWVADARTYAGKDSVAKIRSKKGYGAPWAGTLQNEYAVLRELGIDAELEQQPEWQILTMPLFGGVPLSDMLQRLKSMDRIRIVAKTLQRMRELNKRGVAYRDLRAENVLVGSDNSVCIVDFDQSVLTSSLSAIAADWFGLSQYGVTPNPALKFLLLSLLPKSGGVLRRARARTGFQQVYFGPEPPSKLSEALKAAWQIAQLSDANAPGEKTAYYSMSLGNCQFVGERPWIVRWEPLRKRVDFRGKNIVELGCNMGLLSNFALIHGAAGTRGVDRDPIIINSARAVTDALGTACRFATANLVSDEDWESPLSGGDMVIAMSLLHWLPEKERVLEFLAKHNEIIYEGHDSLATECQRLHSIGFHNVEVVSISERGREVLYGYK